MQTPLLRKLLSVVLASALLSPLVPAHATESLNNQTVTLEKLAYFLTPDGENVQIQPGSYQLNALPDSLQVNPSDGITDPVELAITMDTHEQELAEPTAASVPGIPESDTSDRHVLALFMPGGLIYEAAGTYSGIRSRDIDPQSLITDPLNIYLEQSVHFLTPEGEGLEVPAGIYSVEGAEQGIRLVTPEKKEGLILEAHSNKDESELETSVALSLPGNAEEEADLHYIVVMAPSGESLQALGTYSGIHQRGLFKKIAKGAGKTLNRAKRTVNRVGNGAKRTAQQIGKGTKHTTQKIGKGIKQTGQKASRFAKKTALEAKKAAEWTARQAAKGALIAAKAVCKAGLTAAKVTAQVQAKILGPVKKQLAKALQLPKAQKALQSAIKTLMRRQGESIQRTVEAAAILANPRNAQAVKGLMNPNTMCNNPAKTVQNTFQKMIGNPIRRALAVVNTGRESQVRTRGSFASASIALGGNAAKVGGGEVGVRYAFDFVNKSHWFLDLAGMVKSNIGGGGGVQIGIFPRKNPVDTGGWFLGAGVSFPLPKVPEALGGGLDFFFDFPLEITSKPIKFKWNLTSPKFFLDHFQGFAVSFGGGKNALPADIALKTGVGIRLSKK